jgi:hypothetical protein
MPAQKCKDSEHGLARVGGGAPSRIPRTESQTPHPQGDGRYRCFFESLAPSPWRRVPGAESLTAMTAAAAAAAMAGIAGVCRRRRVQRGGATLSSARYSRTAQNRPLDPWDSGAHRMHAAAREPAPTSLHLRASGSERAWDPLRTGNSVCPVSNTVTPLSATGWAITPQDAHGPVHPLQCQSSSQTVPSRDRTEPRFHVAEGRVWTGGVTVIRCDRHAVGTCRGSRELAAR